MWIALALLLAAVPGQETQRARSARGEVRVERVLVDAYVTTGSGEPIPDLTASDFRVEVAGRPVELESVEWIPAGRPEAVPSRPERRERQRGAPPRSRGRPDA